MSIDAIESSADRPRLPEMPVYVPSHITAAAKSLGIPASLVTQAFAAGASLSDVAYSRGISKADLVAAMQANPPASPAEVQAVANARAAISPTAGALDVTI